MNTYKSLLAALMVGGALASCSEDVIEPGNGGNDNGFSAGAIHFSINSGTRAHYSKTDRLQMNWNAKDKIKIWSPHAYAEKELQTRATEGGLYEIKGALPTAQDPNEYNAAEMNPEKDGNGKSKQELFWGSNGIHEFFCAYYGNPETGFPDFYGNVEAKNIGEVICKDSVRDGSDIMTYTLKCKYNTRQMLIPVDVAIDPTKDYTNIPIDGRTKQTDGTYTGTTTAKTDFITQTDQAYVVSYKKTLKPEEDVDLHFKPIMTMIDLVITGSDDEDIYLSSVWVTLPDACDMLYGGQSATEMLDALDGYGYFDYKLVGNKNTDKLAQNEVPGVPVYNPTTNRQRRTFQFIFSRDFNGKYAPNTLEKADANNGDTFGYTRFVRVPKGGSITATLMLPPVEVRRDQLEIEVKSAGWGTNIYTMTSTASIPSGSKTQITLPKWKTNDWVDMGQHDANGNALLWKTKNIGANAVTEYGKYFARAWNQGNFDGVTLTEQGHTNYNTEFVPTPAMMRHLVPQPHSYTASTKFPYSVTNFNRTEIYEDSNWKPNNLPFYQYANYLLEAVAEDYCNQAWTNFNTKSTSTDSDNGKQSRGSDMSGYVFTSIKTGNCIFVPAGGFFMTVHSDGNDRMDGKGLNCNMWCNDNSDLLLSGKTFLMA